MINTQTPTNIMFVGDTHGSSWDLTRAINAAGARDISHMIVLGDFGFWAASHGVGFLDQTNKRLAEQNITLYWVDGNHEDHRALNELPLAEDGTRPIRSNIFHLPRGFRWTWGELRFLAFGGAYSVDRDWRKLGVSYFTEETATPEQIQHAVAGGVTDVLIMHDSPAGVPNDITDIPENQEKGVEWFGQHNIDNATAHRELLRPLLTETKPAIIFHGHYHKEFTHVFAGHDHGHTMVMSLDESSQSLRSSTYIMSLESLKENVEYLRAGTY